MPPTMAKVMLHPGMTPVQSSIDFQKLDAAGFRALFKRTDYEEIVDTDAASGWALRGGFTVKDTNPASGNRVLVKLELSDEGIPIARIYLSATAMVEMATHLLEFAVATANVNTEPAVVANSLLALLGKFLAPEQFQRFRDSVMLAAHESLRAQILVDEAKG